MLKEDAVALFSHIAQILRHFTATANKSPCWFHLEEFEASRVGWGGWGGLQRPTVNSVLVQVSHWEKPQQTDDGYRDALITDTVTFKADSFAVYLFLRGEGNESCTTSCSPLIVAAWVGRLQKQHIISRTKEEKKKRVAQKSETAQKSYSVKAHR